MKLNLWLVATSVLLTGSSAIPVNDYSSYTIHEKRDISNKKWAKREAVPGHTVIPLRIALREQNHHLAPSWLMQVSDPSSSKYGKHWSPSEVAKAFKPSDETIDSVSSWLVDSGLHPDRLRLANGQNWLYVNTTVDEAERLFKTKYHTFEHFTGATQVACDEVHLPSHLKEHIDLVLPSVHMDTKVGVKQPEKRLNKRHAPFDRHWSPPGTGRGPGWGGWNRPKPAPFNPHNPYFKELTHCNESIVPDCLRALYKFGPGRSKNPKNSYGIVEYTPESYLGSDLDIFFANFSRNQVGNRPIEVDIDGGFQQTQYLNFSFQGEPDLDLEYALVLTYPQNVTLYQVGDAVEGASFNDFLDALDASYCTYEGGDDPNQDAVYPDPEAGGFKGPKQCGGAPLAKVISTSYSYNEWDLTPFYEQRQCNEYMKLGLMGTSILYSSGDDGVAGNFGECIDPVTGNYTDGKSGLFNPSFPGTCPWITSVGATQVPNNTNIVTALAQGKQPEIACQVRIYSGGGFSNVFPLPSYQQSAVKGWFAKYPPPYGADRFNNSQTTRGLPDVSANGARYVTVIDGQYRLVYGTSASSPTFGSILTLINEERLNAGKSSVGFVNPVLYANPSALNDVTQGGNPGCGTPGFSSAPGWDPVTGLGTPNYPKLLRAFMALP